MNDVFLADFISAPAHEGYVYSALQGDEKHIIVQIDNAAIQFYLTVENAEALRDALDREIGGI